MSEIWKGVPSLEDKYEISDKGNLRSITRQVPTKSGTRTVIGKILKTQLNYRGYSIVSLSLQDKSLKTFTIHQLVCMAHIPKFTKGTELNHIDGDKQNNALNNLEVSNPSHNQLHAVRTGLVPKQGLSKFNNVTYVKNPKAKKRWAASIRHAGNSSYGWKTFDLEEDAAKHVDSILDSIQDTERNRNFP